MRQKKTTMVCSSAGSFWSMISLLAIAWGRPHEPIDVSPLIAMDMYLILPCYPSYRFIFSSSLYFLLFSLYFPLFSFLYTVIPFLSFCQNTSRLLRSTSNLILISFNQLISITLSYFFAKSFRINDFSFDGFAIDKCFT